MKTYRFQLHPFRYDDKSEDEREMIFKACAEDARSTFETADVVLTGDILSISVSKEDELSEIDCRDKLKLILQQDCISLGATPL